MPSQISGKFCATTLCGSSTTLISVPSNNCYTYATFHLLCSLCYWFSMCTWYLGILRQACHSFTLKEHHHFHLFGVRLRPEYLKRAIGGSTSFCSMLTLCEAIRPSSAYTIATSIYTSSSATSFRRSWCSQSCPIASTIRLGSVEKRAPP